MADEKKTGAQEEMGKGKVDPSSTKPGGGGSTGPKPDDKAGDAAKTEGESDDSDSGMTDQARLQRARDGVENAYTMSQNRGVNRVLEGVRKDLDKLLAGKSTP